jgi:hypothetical protein
MIPTREEARFKLLLEKPAEEQPAFLQVIGDEDGALRKIIRAHQCHRSPAAPNREGMKSGEDAIVYVTHISRTKLVL